MKSPSSDGQLYPAVDIPVVQMDIPVGIPIETVQLVDASLVANKGLSPEDLAESEAFSTKDWSRLAAGKRPRRGCCMSFVYECCFCCAAKETPNPDKAKLRAVEAEGGGTKVLATVESPSSLMLLARRVAAARSAPLESLHLTCADGFGPGTANEVYAGGEAFALITRALMPPPHGSSCLANLRELCLSKIIVNDENARALAAALRGHTSLTALELWNVQLEDGGALALGTLAAADGLLSLSSLNLGRNLLSADTRARIDVAKRPGVSVRMF